MQRQMHTDNCESVAIGLEKNGELIAVTSYGKFNQVSMHAHIAIAEGERLTREFIWYMLYYPFEQAGVNALIILVDAANEKAIRLQNHLGYETVGTIPNSCPNGAMLVRVLYKDNCRWLKTPIKLRGIQ
jgi:RimJ/RimL family protein N-acetyltransferase